MLNGGPVASAIQHFPFNTEHSTFAFQTGYPRPFMTTKPRTDGRASEEMRRVLITPHFSKHAEGSALIEVGDTRVICTASVQEKVPPFLYRSGKGWVTAEYGMLPRATTERTDREAARGKQGGRTMEIQRLIGRSLRAAV